MKKSELRAILEKLEEEWWEHVLGTLTAASLAPRDEPQILSIFYTMVEKRAPVHILRSMMKKFRYIQLDSKSVSLQKLIKSSSSSQQSKTMLACACQGSRCKRIIRFLLLDRDFSQRLRYPTERLDYSELDFDTFKLIFKHLDDIAGLQHVALAVWKNAKRDELYWTKMDLVKDSINSAYQRFEHGSILHAFVSLWLDVCPRSYTSTIQQEVTGQIVSVIQQIMDKYPELVPTKDKHGDLPLHVCARARVGNANYTILKAILEAEPEGAFERNNDGRFAIHYTTENFNVESTLTLVERAPECVHVACGKTGLLPFQLLATCKNISLKYHINGIFQLLSKSPMVVESATRGGLSTHGVDAPVMKKLALKDLEIARLERKHKLEMAPHYAKRQCLLDEWEAQKNLKPEGNDNDVHGIE